MHGWVSTYFVIFSLPDGFSFLTDKIISTTVASETGTVLPRSGAFVDLLHGSSPRGLKLPAALSVVSLIPLGRYVTTCSLSFSFLLSNEI